VSFKASQPIGVFDSGLGGLTILKALQKKLPNEQFIYFGDTAHLPYGEKSEDALMDYVQRITQFLKTKKCKLLVVACNSATTVIHKTENLPYEESQIVEVITPVVERIKLQKRFKEIAIIGTRKTISSGMFTNALSRDDVPFNVQAKATPLLVPMIEEGFVDDEILKPIFDRYFQDFHQSDLLIPACTHYPIIYEQIERYFHKRLKVLHTPKIIAEEVEKKLSQQHLLANKKTAQDEFYLSDVTEDFLKEARLFLGAEVSWKKSLVTS
jgi:glutamate racemase